MVTTLPENERSALIEVYGPKTIPELCKSHVEMISHFTESIQARGLNLTPSYTPDAPLLAWDTIYYTFLSAAALLEDKPLLGPLPMRQDSCLEALTLYGSKL